VGSTDETLYLREDVYFEPLLNHWYAWPYLISPVSGARHIVNTHRRIMQSFVNNAKLHIMAAKQPGMAGGEFLDCSEEQIPDIKALIQKIDTQHSDLVELSDAVKTLDELLRTHTSGESVEHLYEQVPDPLKGFVEIFMDMEHNASFRLIESLLYKSRYYKTSLQGLSFGLLSNVKERPFVLSTPRLPDEKHLQIHADFNAPIVDKIFKAREFGISRSEIVSLFDEFEILGGLSYEDLFTHERPEYHHEPVMEGKVSLKYLGHAGFMIETSEVAILVDPVIASRGSDNKDEVISFSQLPPKIDYICITHNHQDHMNLETLLQLRYKTDKVVVPRNNCGTLADPSLKLLLKQFHFDVIEVDDMEEIACPDGKIISIPFLGEHGDLNVRSKTAWFVELHGKTIFVGADSSNLDPNMYRHIKNEIGHVDIMAIGMECVGAPFTWLYGALYTKLVSKKIRESRRLNGSDFKQGYDIAQILKPNRIFLYALGMEPWYKYFMGIDYSEDSRQIIETQKMLDACKGENIPIERLYGRMEMEIA